MYGTKAAGLGLRSSAVDWSKLPYVKVGIRIRPKYERLCYRHVSTTVYSGCYFHQHVTFVMGEKGWLLTGWQPQMLHCTAGTDAHS